MTRTAQITRKTGETDVSLTLGVSGSGAGTRNTGIGFFDHMLDLVARHGRLGLDVSVTGDLEILRVSHEVEREQVRVLASRKGDRDEAAVRGALDAMLAAARDGSNMIAPMLEAVRAEATLGEICGVLRDEWGVYTEPAGF